MKSKVIHIPKGWKFEKDIKPGPLSGFKLPTLFMRGTIFLKSAHGSTLSAHIVKW